MKLFILHNDLKHGFNIMEFVFESLQKGKHTFKSVRLYYLF